MNDPILASLIALSEQVFGRTLFWTLVAVAVLVTAVCRSRLVRGRFRAWQKLWPAERVLAFAAVAAVLVAVATDPAGQTRRPGWLEGLGTAMLGVIGLAILVYTLQALVRRPI